MYEKNSITAEEAKNIALESECTKRRIYKFIQEHAKENWTSLRYEFLDITPEVTKGILNELKSKGYSVMKCEGNGGPSNEYEISWECPSSVSASEELFPSESDMSVMKLATSKLGIRVMSVLKVKGNPNKLYVNLAGGNNGNPDWEYYLLNLREVVQKLRVIYNTSSVILEKIDNDCLDDVFYATFIVWKE